MTNKQKCKREERGGRRGVFGGGGGGGGGEGGGRLARCGRVGVGLVRFVVGGPRVTNEFRSYGRSLAGLVRKSELRPIRHRNMHLHT